MLGNHERHEKRRSEQLLTLHRISPQGGAPASAPQNPALGATQALPEGVSRLVLAHLLQAHGQHAEADKELAAAQAIAVNSACAWLAHLCTVSAVPLSSSATKDGTKPARRSRDNNIAVSLASIPPSVLARLHDVAGRTPGNSTPGEFTNPARAQLSPGTEQDLPVRVYTLGRFGLLLNGKQVQFSRKVPRMPLELLKALIAFGGRKISTTRLAEALWPDADGDAAIQSLDINLHRLRRIIGTEAVRREHGCLSLDPQVVWVDIWAFERGLVELETACREARHDQTPALVTTVLSCYRGAFLSDDTDAAWMINARERLRNGFLRHLQGAAQCFARNEQPAQAMVCYEKALEIDACAEVFYQGLMKLLIVGQRRAEAIGIYDRCRKLLATQLGLTPSPETEALRVCALGNP
jgi:DNA-binding SARP family transcriptional activator